MAEVDGGAGPALNILQQQEHALAGVDPQNNNINHQQTGNPDPPPPPAWMVEHNNAQADPIDVTPLRNHSRSQGCYNPSGQLLQARKGVVQMATR